ncbi:MAG: FliG C-terminal domain-containing protein [bacterium]
MHKKLLFLTFILFLGQAVHPQGILRAAEESEIASQMAEDINRLLEELLGPGKGRVFITIEGEKNIINNQTEVTTNIGNSQDDSQNQLPGYSTSKYLERLYQLARKQNQILQKEHEQSTKTPGFTITKIYASLVLDRSIQDAQANAVRTVISDLLRLDTQRGDNLILLRANMIPAWKSAFLTPEGYRSIFWISALVVILLMIFILAYLLGLRIMRGLQEFASARRTSQLSVDSKQAAAGRGGGGGGDGMLLQGQDLALGSDMPEVFDLEGGRTGTVRLLESKGGQFSFLDTIPVNEILHLLEHESSEEMALLIAFLADKKPHISSKLLLTFPVEKRSEITKYMMSLKEADPDRLAALEDRLRTRTETTLKGSDKLGKLLSFMDAGDRSNILGDLSIADPEGSAKVEQSLITFEDICKLASENLRPVVTSVSYQNWGTALRGMPRETSETILALFPGDIRPVVEDIIATPQNKDKIVAARSGIVTSAMSLAEKGKISLGTSHSPEVV